MKGAAANASLNEEELARKTAEIKLLHEKLLRANDEREEKERLLADLMRKQEEEQRPILLKEKVKTEKFTDGAYSREWGKEGRKGGGGRPRCCADVSKSKLKLKVP